jgi:hypothetical protein
MQNRVLPYATIIAKSQNRGLLRDLPDVVLSWLDCFTVCVKLHDVFLVELLLLVRDTL